MDAYIDPTSRSYVAAQGDLQRDPAGSLANAIYLRLMTPLGSYWANAELGSRLHELVRSKAVATVEVMAAQYARAALQGLLDDGRAASIDIETKLVPMADASRAVQLRVVVVDAKGHEATFTHHVPVA